MADDRIGILATLASFTPAGWAIIASTLGTILAPVAALVVWIVGRRDRAEDREEKERTAVEAERARLHEQSRADVALYRDRWLEADKRALVWERRCRVMDDHAHRLRHQINNERQALLGRLELAGIALPQLPDNPPLPKIEDL